MIQLRLIDPFGNVVSPTLNSTRLISDIGRLTLNSAGTYAVLIEGYIGSSGDLSYTLNVAPGVDPAPQPLALGTTVAKSLTVPAERDTYTFNLASNSLLYFDSLTNNGNFNWSLAGPAGTIDSAVAFNASDGLSVSNPVLNLVAGSYTLTVAGAATTTGAYSFRLSDLAAVPALNPGTAVNGTLAAGISTDLYQFTATAGQSYYIASQVTSGNGGINDRLRLVDPLGNIVFSQTPTSDAGRITLNISGKYTLLVEGYIGNTGSLGYTINVIPDVDPAPTNITLTGLIDATPIKTFDSLEGNSTGTVVLATFIDPNPAGTLSDFTSLSVDWGATIIGTPD